MSKILAVRSNPATGIAEFGRVNPVPFSILSPTTTLQPVLKRHGCESPYHQPQSPTLLFILAGTHTLFVPNQDGAGEQSITLQQGDCLLFLDCLGGPAIARPGVPPGHRSEPGPDHAMLMPVPLPALSQEPDGWEPRAIA